jgi:hypothetical protein
MSQWKRALRPILSALAASVVAACSAADGFQPIAPDNPSLEYQTSSPQTDGGGGAHQTSADTSYGYMIVGPQGGNWVFGEHKINFPANSVCDMTQTNYFDWGKPCTPISSSVRIDLKWWRDAAGHPHVDFRPALRFQPTKKGDVVLYLKDPVAAKAQNPVIQYCPFSGLPCIDESYFDSDLATKKDNRGGFVFRIIRHFSGYNVWA